MLSIVLAIISSVLILGADQYTKYFISSNFELYEKADFINGIIDIQYIHNDGGAWGILSGNTWVLLSVTTIVILILITLLLKIGMKSKLLFWAASLIISGGIGNLIDRIFRGGSVVDFLHFEFFPTFPIFNIADISVVIGSGLLSAYFVIDMINDYRKNKRNGQN
ncbi:MAG: signal peptidase II [Clostridia bacterium]|nr:signal peptidase II [Clostridia bacterium]